ncbi:MAG: Serine/threonine-protein kinase tousled-like 2, partial [Paramarteilia canceri]
VNDVLQKFMSNQLKKKTLKNTGIQTELFLPESAHHCNGNPIKNSIEMLTKQNQELLDNIEHLNSQSQNHKLSLSKSIEITKKLLIEKSELERKTTQQNCSENSLTLGRFVMQRYGSSYSEVWHSGTRQKQLL